MTLPHLPHPVLAMTLQPAAPWSPAAFGDAQPKLRRVGAVLILGAHLLLGWVLVQAMGQRIVARELPPLMLQWVKLAAPAPSVPERSAEALRKPTLSVVPAAPTSAAAIPVRESATESPLHTEPATAALSDTQAQASPTPAPPTPTTPRWLPSSQLQYLQPPEVVYPRQSRRLNETGTVWIRVVVDAEGMPREVSLQRSCGHSRLDEQALRAMRGARFKPMFENGQAIEWMAVAPISFELDG
jgi:protein TonB